MVSPSRSQVLFGLIGAAVIAGLVYAFWPRPVLVDMATVVRGPLTVTVSGDGQTRVREVYVVSAPVSGRVLRIERHVGDGVAADETVLATIEPSDPAFLDLRARRQAEANVHAAEAARALAAAEVERVRAELDYAGAELERARRLAAGGTISDVALDRAELEFKTQQAAVDAANAALAVRAHELETAQAVLIEPGTDGARNAEYCCVDVRAPVDGRVLRLVQESEAVVAAGAPLVEIGDPVDLEIVVDLLSTDAVKVAEGAPVIIDGWGGTDDLAGRVRRVEPAGFTKVSALGIEEQRVNVIIDFVDPPEDWQTLGHGYRVNARVVVWQSDGVLKVPVTALFRAGADWALFVDDDGRARQQLIEVGQNDGIEAEILSGLAAGARVIVHPSDQVTEDTRVAARDAP